MKTCRIKFWLLLMSFCFAFTWGGQIASAASVPVMIKDIKTHIKDNSRVRNLAAGGSTLFFTAFDLAHGDELWKSNGTAAGTVMVKDILPGSSSSYHDPNYMTYWNSFVFFEARDAIGWSLWKSDGTAANTVLVSRDVDPEQFIAFNSALYFSGYSKGLWKTNGTTLGTVEVKGGIGTLDNLVVVGANKLYFTNGNNLWVSDGTTSGTVLLQSGIYPTQLTSVNGTLYFQGWDSVNDYRLWTSNGTPAGTVALPYAATPYNLTDVNGTLFFTTDDPTDGTSLMKVVGGSPTAVKSGISPSDLFNWNGILYFAEGGDLCKSDGTLAGTVVVMSNIYPDRFATANSTLYFKGWDNVHGYELWKSDGTPAGTVMVKDIFSVPAVSYGNPDQLTNVSGTLYFTATDSATGTQLWKSDGSAAGTILVKNTSPGSQDASPSKLFNVDGTLYFAADDYDNGNKLWQSNGTTAGTTMVAGLTGSNPVPLANVNGTLFFAANSDDLWKRVGTSPAVLVKAGVTTNDPKMVCAINGTLYFRGWDGTHGWELWKSDGTAAGTVMVKDIQTLLSVANSSNPYAMTALNGTLYFIATSGAPAKTQLWKSNGTADGTVVVNDSITNVTDLLMANGKLFFQGDDTSNTNALWVSDGTNTTVLKNSLEPTKLTAVGSTLFFQGWTSPLGYELWKSDGTVAGTVLVKDINTTGNSYPLNLTNVNGTLYFSVKVGSAGATEYDQLWKSNGTTAGTVLVKDLPPVYTYTSIDSLTSVHGILAFTYMDKSYQPTRDDSAELWISDGTSAGTVKVAEIFPGDFGSAPASLTMANTPPNGIDKEALFFSAIDPLVGREIFILDFTPPVSAITLPLNNAYLRGTSFTISGTAGDSMPGTGVTRVEVSTDNGVTWHNATGSGAWATWQYTWANPLDGVYTVKSRATDLATNVQTPLASIIVTVDNTPPVSAITQPLYYRTAPALITGTTSDNLSGIAKVEVSTDGGTTWNLATVTSGTWQYSWTPLPVDGSHPVKSRATDRSGNVQNPVAAGTIMIDKVLPTSAITLPTNNGYFHITSTTVSGTAGDDRSGVAKVEVSVNNGTWTTATGTASWSIISTLPVVNGTYTIRSRATDRAGNVQSPLTSRNIIIDNTPHTLYIDLTGSGGGSVKLVEKNMICNTDCQTSVYAGDPVTIQKTVDQYSLFGGWSNACSGSGDCIFTMPGITNTTTATATFNRDTTHAVKVDPDLTFYSSIMGAYSAAATGNGDVIGIWGVNFNESLLFDQDKQITLRGGDNGAHTVVDGMTTVILPIPGKMAIRKGTVRVNNLSIR